MKTFPTSPNADINKLGIFILNEVPDEPSKYEGAVNTAIRIIRALMVDNAKKTVLLQDLVRILKKAELWKDDWDILIREVKEILVAGDDNE